MSDAPTPEAFAAVADLIRLIADPDGCAKRMTELRKLGEQVAKSQAKLETERAAHDRKAGADAAELAEREQKLRARAVDLMVRENAMAETARVRGLSDDRFHLDPNLGPGGRSYSGLTRAHEVE
jgi:hypothetical protein